MNGSELVDAPNEWLPWMMTLEGHEALSECSDWLRGVYLGTAHTNEGRTRRHSLMIKEAPTMMCTMMYYLGQYSDSSDYSDKDDNTEDQ